MTREEFALCIAQVDKAFALHGAAFADRRLTEDELRGMCERAEQSARAFFPQYAEGITVTLSPHNNTQDDFAGYELRYEGEDGGYAARAEFDFGAHGVDVV